MAETTFPRAGLSHDIEPGTLHSQAMAAEANDLPTLDLTAETGGSAHRLGKGCFAGAVFQQHAAFHAHLGQRLTFSYGNGAGYRALAGYPLWGMVAPAVRFG